MYILIEDKKEFRKGSNEPAKIGGTNKTNKIVRNMEAMEVIEDIFMNIAFKDNRAASQREARRAKR